MASQLWSVNTLGGYFYSNQLSDELRDSLQPMAKFRQFCDVKNAAGKGKGETFTWDIVSNVAVQGATLVETNTMPETNFTITQGTLTVTEYGNAVPYSQKLESLGQIGVRQPVMKALRNDAAKVLDASAFNQFNLTPLRYGAATTTSGALATAGTCTTTNSQAMGTPHVKLIVDIMKERNIPAYTGDDYIALAWPTTYRGVKNTLETLHQYTETGLTMIFNGEIGRYENVRFIEQTNIPHGGAADTTTFNALTNTGDPWNGGFSDWAFFCGEDTVAEGIVIPEEIRAKIPTDFGRSKGVAWYGLLGYGLVQTAQLQARVVKWDSAV